MPAPYEGGCVCGAVRYRLVQEPLTFFACHCTDCQRHTGAAYGLSMIVRRAALEVVRGAPHEYDFTADGRRRRGMACGTCFTRLWGVPPRFPEVRVVRPGTLDDLQGLRPIAHIWARSKQRWIDIPEDQDSFDTQPADSRALIDLWRARVGRE